MNNTVKFAIIMLLAVFVSSLCFFLKEITTPFTAGILFATLIAIIWYTIETNKMQQAVLHQTDVSVKPRLVINYSLTSGKHFVQNVGNGTDVNIKIDPVEIDNDFLASGVKAKINFDFIDDQGWNCTGPEMLNLFSKDECILSTKTTIDGKESSTSLDPHLTKRYGERDFKVKIKYEDILGNKFEDYMILGKSGPYLDYTTRIENK